MGFLAMSLLLSRGWYARPVRGRKRRRLDAAEWERVGDVAGF